MEEKKDSSAQAPYLEVLISTMGPEGLARVEALLPSPVAGIGYVISCQDPESAIKDGDTESLRKRADVALRIYKDVGLSRNRNHALDMARAEIVVIADDDVEYYTDALKKIATIMQTEPTLDVISFRYEGPGQKIYPPGEHDLAHPYPGYNPASIELGFRRESLRNHDMRFSELAGLGAPYLKSGEESIFLARCLQKGLRGKFVPVTVCRHENQSTGMRDAASPGHIRAKGAYIRIRYGLLAGALRCVLTSFRSPAPTLKALLWTFQGFAYSIRHNSRL